MPKYIALKRGYDGKRVIKEGEVFEFNGPLGSWMKPYVPGEKVEQAIPAATKLSGQKCVPKGEVNILPVEDAEEEKAEESVEEVAEAPKEEAPKAKGKGKAKAK